MELKHGKIGIRSAASQDAPILCEWWNDGNVMAHAGFPNGLGTTVEKVRAELEACDDTRNRICMILCEEVPVGELNYRIGKDNTAEIGIKICKADHQNHGLGKQVLSLLIQMLFSKYGIQKIKLDTNLNNLRAQHVYEQLGFQKTAVEKDSWKDQLGCLQSAVLYELTPQTFVSYI